jgi:hypothetical protein
VRKSLFAVPAVALLSLGLLPVTSAGAQETSVSDGIYEVRRDVQPGNYRTDGPEEGGSCYYARLSGNTGTLDEVLANGNTSGPASLTVNWDDKYVQFSGGCTWAIDGDPGPTASAPAPAPGPETTEPAPAPAEGPVSEPEEDLNCDDVTREQAQEILDADPTDPNNFDSDDDGLACEGDDSVPNMSEGMATGGFEIK